MRTDNGAIGIDFCALIAERLLINRMAMKTSRQPSAFIAKRLDILNAKRLRLDAGLPIDWSLYLIRY
jgi:hypothetical protein